MAFERSSSADTADFTEGIQKYDCLCNEFSNDFYKNNYTKMNCWRSVADKFDICRDSLRSGCSPTRLHFFLSLVFPSLVRPIWRQVRSLLDLYLLFPQKTAATQARVAKMVRVKNPHRNILQIPCRQIVVQPGLALEMYRVSNPSL